MIGRISSESPPPRLLVDFAGPFYTFKLETLHESVAAYEQSLSRLMADSDYPECFGRVTPIVEGGQRDFHVFVG